MYSYNEKGQLNIQLPLSGLELVLENPDNLEGEHLRRCAVVSQNYEPNALTSLMALVAVCTVEVTNLKTDEFPDLSQPLSTQIIESKITDRSLSKISLKELFALPIKDSLYLTEVVTKNYNFLSSVV